MGLVPEESNVYRELTAWQNLMFTANLYRVPKHVRQERGRELLDLFGMLLPFFLFFSFSVRREASMAQGLARLLAMNVFFTASSAGPVIIPMERRTQTYDRLLVAPMSLVTLLIGKTTVGVVFALIVSCISLIFGLVILGGSMALPALMPLALILAAFSAAALGLMFASVPAQSVGSIMMPSTLIRWPLLFISGIFVALEGMHPLVRVLSYISPLSYAQDLINRAVFGEGFISLWIDLVAPAGFLILFLFIAARLHQCSRVLGY